MLFVVMLCGSCIPSAPACVPLAAPGRVLRPQLNTCKEVGSVVVWAQFTAGLLCIGMRERMPPFGSLQELCKSGTC